MTRHEQDMVMLIVAIIALVILLHIFLEMMR